ncbi:uncharacterized protein BO96DRAFT_428776 [Aspergillus niger CBS 101883]|uniref:uncharacterized protein n=1 Tax=Aspergillus lacticoffeatus (strain CBS 101883) TaxID=1450533 RepID=UPI000D7F3D98|nr:uncharacterized protein BO96DRAFT_428776 [Aspergillus niger CBS 101883]PYH62040.1 hypothetical protein BO96DRAFT_428776 [Aspergillus niger CBS 101883]
MSRYVQARLTYLQWQPSYTHTRPYRIGVFSGRRKRNADRDKTTNLVFHVADHPETIRDIRGLIDAPPFDLDINGFAYKRCPPPAITKPYEYSDPQKINDIFLPECEAILKEHVNGADEVKIFDWKIRKKKSAKEKRTRNPNLQGFARQVHIDTLLTRDEIGTPTMERIRNHLPEESQHLLSGRVQLIILWRPISGPIEDHPMAVCDGQTMDATKLIETDMIRGNYTGTMLYPQYEANSARRWYYMSEQETQDVLLFKGFDTKEDSVKCEWSNTLPFNSPYPSQAGGFEGALDFVRQIESAATGTLASNRKHNKALQTLPRLPLLIENKVFYETLFVLPTRRVADDLFTKYWEHIDPIFPWLDQGTITANYDMVWGDSALDMNEKAFHCILNLIFATSSMIGTTSEVYTHTQCASVYFDRAKQLMSFNLMEMHNLEVIQIFLLSAVYLQHTNLAQEFVQNIGLAIQIARTLGVQSRESCRLLTNKHEQDLAMRVWFGCIIMDRIAAMTFGSKPQISHEIVKKSAVPPTSAATQQVLRPNTPSSINGDFYSAFCHLHVILGDILESLYPLSSEHPSSPEFGASIPTEKDDILAPQKLTDLFRIEFDLSTWYSGLPPQLQVGIGRTDSRIANVLHARSARDIVDFFKDLNNRQTAMSDRNTFPSHWYIISYKELTLQDIYMAATVLIAEYLCPITQSHIPISEIDDLLDQVDDILKCCEPSTNIAHKCRVTLKQLNEKVRSTQREVDRPQALESSRSTGEVSLEDFNYDFGPEGLIMNPLDSYPFSWNDWPISLADIADEGPGGAFRMPY